MAEFDESVALLEKARRAFVEAEKAARDAQRAVRQAGGDKAAPRDLLRRAKTTRAQLGRRRQALERASAAFEAFSDPRKAVRQLPDSDPMLLLPLRLETRFGSAGGRDQLWVRIYPDSCLVDAFEERLSDAELASAKTYWIERWCAAGSDVRHRAAWRQLVASHGTGRARHILASYTPVNAAEEPHVAEDEVALVIPTRTLPPEAEDIAGFWKAMWHADGDAAEQQAAFDDLAARLGAEKAEATIAANVPVRFGESGPAAGTRRLAAIVFLVLPEDPPTAASAWNAAPVADPLPERFVLLLDRAGAPRREVLGEPVRIPLHVGFDPTGLLGAPPEAKGATLGFAAETAWLADFDEAVKAGMGLRVDLDPDEARDGFDRIYVVGVALAPDPAQGRARLERFIMHRLHANADFALLPQGTPTNNTEEENAGFARRSDPDRVFDAVMGPGLFSETPDARFKSDGQWLAEALGVDPALIARVLYSDGQDQRIAHAMRTALWPGTIGYFLSALLSPVLGRATIAEARAHFIAHVAGAGCVPAIRIGRQPYGILPVTAFDRITWLAPQVDHPKRDPFLFRLLPLLHDMRKRWSIFAQAVAKVGGGDGDPGQELLDVLGLHPTSAEFHFRYAQSDTQLANLFRLVSVVWTDLAEPEDAKRQVLDFLAALGAAPAEVPQIARLLLQGLQGVLDGGVVASEPLQPGYETEHQVYIAWLADAAQRSVETLRTQRGLPGERVPHALLYILLRHALLLGYADAAIAARRRNPDFTEAVAAAALREDVLPHILAERVRPESRWESLFIVDPLASDGRQIPLGQYLAEMIGAVPETEDLAAQIEALRILARATRGEADRALRHHLDTCSHRLDAWLLGAPNAQLARMERKGIHLGAYGWLHEIRPKPRVLPPAKIDAEDQARLDPDGHLPPLMEDAASGGLVHAPSLDQAVTGAILRSAYMTATSKEEGSAIGVNLSSERVRGALALMEGMRTGQSLGALLGYRFERGLHDRFAEAETDGFLLELRKAFPLVAGALTDTAAPDADKGKDAARNVVDGLKLLAQIRKSGQRAYPFGLALPAADAAATKVMSEEADRLADMHDALGDMALAETVFQSVQGNFDRAAAAVDAFAKGEAAPVPDVVQTPSTGIELTLRLAVHLREELAPAAGASPRVLAEPELNAWLAAILPPLSRIGCRVAWNDPVDGSRESAMVTLGQLGLAPLDLVHLWQTAEPDGAFAAIASLVAERVIATQARRFRCDATLSIAFASGPARGFSLVEAGALLRHVAALVKAARPLRPTDLVPANAATFATLQAVEGDAPRLAAPRARLETLRAAVATLAADCDAALADPAPRNGGALDAVDALVDRAAALFVAAGRLGIGQCSPDRFRDMQRRFLASVMANAGGLLTERRARLARCDAALARLPAPDPTPILREADLELPARVPAAGADAAALEAAVRGRRAAFGTLTAAVAAITTARSSSIGDAVAALDAVLDDPGFRSEEVSTAALRGEIAAGVAEIAAAARALSDVAARRIQAADARLAEAAAAPDAARGAELCAEAAQALFGEGFLHLPRFTLQDAARDGFEKALAAAQSGDTLEYLKVKAGIPLPVEEWLHGVARVRAQAQELEGAMLYGEALGVAEIALVPMQLPYRDGDSWLGLQYPEDYDIDGTRLLHTVHLAALPDGSGRFKGLVLDDWTEVVPGGRRTAETDVKDLHNQTTGVAFHFDRPNAEAPNAFLLVTPATWDGAWHWEDIVGALDSTRELMQTRAVEPEHIDEPALGQMLPATYMAAAPRDVTITAVLAENIDVAQFMKVTP